MLRSVKSTTNNLKQKSLKEKVLSRLQNSASLLQMVWVLWISEDLHYAKHKEIAKKMMWFAVARDMIQHWHKSPFLNRLQVNKKTCALQNKHKSRIEFKFLGRMLFISFCRKRKFLKEELQIMQECIENTCFQTVKAAASFPRLLQLLWNL